MLIFRRRSNRFEIGFASFLLSVSTIGADFGSMNKIKSDPRVEIQKKESLNQLKINLIQARALLLSVSSQEGAEVCDSLKSFQKSTAEIENSFEVYASSVLARKYSVNDTSGPKIGSEFASKLSSASYFIRDLDNQLSELCENQNDSDDREGFRNEYLELTKQFSQKLQEAEHLTFILSEYLF